MARSKAVCCAWRTPTAASAQWRRCRWASRVPLCLLLAAAAAAHGAAAPVRLDSSDALARALAERVLASPLGGELGRGGPVGSAGEGPPKMAHDGPSTSARAAGMRRRMPVVDRMIDGSDRVLVGT